MNILKSPLPMLALAALAAASPARAEPSAELSAEQLAKLAQNPVANLVSVPFQNNTNLNYGPDKRNQNILNIQPVVPFSPSADWNVITRTIIPVISQPFANGEREDGVGNIQFSAFLSPANASGWIWGAGVIAQLPSGLPELGNDRWGLGPTAVALHLEKGNPWVYGALANNIWSVGSGDSPKYNNFLLQPFVNYNLPGGTYLTFAPIVTANWEAESGNQWTVPLGGGVGKIFHLGRLPVNTQLSAYYNVVRPDDGPNWQIRAQVQFMFPK